MTWPKQAIAIQVSNALSLGFLPISVSGIPPLPCAKPFLMFRTDILEFHCAKYLSMIELPLLQQVDVATHAALEASGAWCDCAAEAMPGVKLAPELLLPTQRRLVLSHYHSLRKVVLLDGARLPLQELNQVVKLARLIHIANASATNHLANGGRAAFVVVGILRFTEQSILDGGDMQEGTLHTSLALKIPCELSHVFSSQGEKLVLQVALKRSSLLLRAGPDSSLHGDAVTVDIACSSPGLVVHQRGHRVAIDGPWAPAVLGVCSFTRSSEAAALASASSSVCVLCIQAGVRQYEVDEWSTLF